ncbi:MAG TPA: YXWGXW repeat-containing protein [Polyangiaceae bacterium]|nr:YXWGXW repeat-containing protein [Polyangiaceae bacterium]
MSSTRLGSITALLLLSACGGGPKLVTVPTGTQPVQAAPLKVDYPPPPAKIEEIRISQGSGGRCVWRDGYWDWTGGRWEWQDGRAVLPAQGCLYALPKLVWTSDSLSFYRPAWYPDPALKPGPKTCTEIACLPIAGSGAAPTNPETSAP